MDGRGPRGAQWEMRVAVGGGVGVGGGGAEEKTRAAVAAMLVRTMDDAGKSGGG